MAKKIKIIDPTRAPNPGETLFMTSGVQYASPHCHALYLGEDDTGRKVLLPTYVDGYAIVNLESIDRPSYRASGRFNIRKEEKDKAGLTIGYEYIFFDTANSNVIERAVKVKKIEGRWIIVSRPENPSWSN